MTKKLTKHGDNLALIIDQPILDNLGITEKTDLDIVVMGDILLIKPRESSSNKDKELEKTATSIMDQYESVFKKLAKTCMATLSRLYPDGAFYTFAEQNL